MSATTVVAPHDLDQDLLPYTVRDIRNIARTHPVVRARTQVTLNDLLALNTQDAEAFLAGRIVTGLPAPVGTIAYQLLPETSLAPDGQALAHLEVVIDLTATLAEHATARYWATFGGDRLTAQFQRETWQRDNAVPVGDPIEFDITRAAAEAGKATVLGWIDAADLDTLRDYATDPAILDHDGPFTISVDEDEIRDFFCREDTCDQVLATDNDTEDGRCGNCADVRYQHEQGEHDTPREDCSACASA